MFLFITLLLGQIIIDAAVQKQGDETNFWLNFSHALFYWNVYNHYDLWYIGFIDNNLIVCNWIIAISFVVWFYGGEQI